jgi:hypothetical protein
MSRQARAGITIHLLLALGLGLIILAMAWYINAARQTEAAPLLLVLKADYQMESALILMRQKILIDGTEQGLPAAETADQRSREIAPGLFLTYFAVPVSPGSLLLKAVVRGRGLDRQLEARLVQRPPSAESPHGTWSMLFSPIAGPTP